MEKLIQIQNGRVHWIFTRAQMPEWNPDDIQVIEYPSDGYLPKVGDLHLNGQFYPALAPEPEPEPVPQSVSRAQGKAALIQSGLWSAVVAYVDAITDPTEKALAEVALNDTTEWLRNSPFLNAAATALGLTETQLDDLFRTAATIQL